MASKTPHSKLVILDRDGVINEDSDLYINHLMNGFQYQAA